MKIDLEMLKERAREAGRVHFSAYPPDRLRFIRATLMGYMPHEAHHIGPWANFRPSGASDGEYPRVAHLSYEQLIELDAAWIEGANEVLKPYNLQLKIYGKPSDGTLAITRKRKE